MSFHFMEYGDFFYPPEEESMTKQSFKDDCDINKILARAQVTGSISHLAKYEAVYGDFENFDYGDAVARVARGREIFEELPSELRREFSQDPGSFFRFVNDPANKDRLEEVMPALARPGSYFPDVSPRTPPNSTLEPVVAAPVVPADPPPAE